MKKIYLFAGLVAMMVASCSTEEQSSGGYVAGSKVTLNASLPNGTRVNEAASDTYGLITNWSSDDSLDVLVNTNTIVSMTKSTGNTFTATPTNSTIGAGFNAGQTIYGVNNKSNDNITTALNGSQLKATLDFTGQNGTVDNLKKYDLMYGKGDPTGNITFNHKICVLRLDINSDLLKTDGVTSLTGLKLKYAATSGSKLFASQEVYNFGATCDSTTTDADSLYLNNTSITVANGQATVYIAVPNRQTLYGTLYIKLKGSNGTISKSYDLTNAITMSNSRMLMSTVHPQAITDLSLSTVKVGNYLFSDGTWGYLADSFGSATPVAVIFSNTTSATDQTNGWAHGYAMALKNASTSVAWGTTVAGTDTGNPTGTFVNTSAAQIADKDGYTHTTKINSSSYPAASAATSYTVAAPSNTSGWYLPSVGQWYDICVNLGKLSSTKGGSGYTDEPGLDGTGYILWTDALTSADSLNAYLTPLTSGTYDIFTWIEDGVLAYWCSSEYSRTSANLVMFDDEGSKGLSLFRIVKTRSEMVRGVLAF